MSNILVINVTGQETRVALIENGTLAELYIERKAERGIVGNIYKGRVVRVLPGMQAAFVDIGTDRAAFLYVNDVLDDHLAFHLDHWDDSDGEDGEDEDGEDEDGEDEDGEDEDGQENAPTEDTPRAQQRRRANRGRIEDLLSPGQELMVQAAKDPIGTKGARITGHISLPGRHLVFMPTVDRVGISRRITSDTERKRLRGLVEELRPDGSGFIVRTAAADVPSDQLRRDMQILLEQWRDVLESRNRSRAPALLHADLDIVPKATRDLVTGAVSRIVVDDWGQHNRIIQFLDKHMPGVNCDVQRYTGRAPIFDAFGIEIEIKRALTRKVWLPSGAYLVIDQTEALTAIDINTGRYVGKTDLEQTITKINLEAVDEIVYQLRLRNLGGLIIIDFIDMEEQDNRDRVYQALSRALSGDKMRTNLLELSPFGLVEMTRKRVSHSLVQQLCEPCPYCAGRGYVKSDATVAYEILRKLNQEAWLNGQIELSVKTHSDVGNYLRRSERESMTRLERHLYRKVRIDPTDAVHREDYEILVTPTE